MLDAVPPTISNKTPAENPKRLKPKYWKYYLLLVVIIMVGFGGYRLVQLIASPIAEQRALAEQVTQLQKKQNQLLLNYQTLHEQTNALLQDKEQLEQKLNVVVKQQSMPKPDWLLLEARYYLQLAQINSHWHQERDVVIALLTEADNRLKLVTNPNVFAVRQAIASEIVQFKTEPSFDQVGLLSQLDALQTALTSLPLLSMDFQASQETDNNTNLTTKWQQSLNTLKKLVVVRYNNDNQYQAALQRQGLKAALNLQFQVAAFGVLERNQPLYWRGIDQLINLLTIHFPDNRNAQLVRVIEQLETLKKQSFNTQELSIQQSLQRLNSVLDKPAEDCKQANEDDSK